MKAIKTFLLVLGFLIFCVLLIVFYSFVHESGHAIVILLLGGEIRSFSFSLFGGQVNHSNIEFTAFSAFVMYVAGVLLPTIFFNVAFVFYRRKVKYKSKIKRLIYHLSFAVFAIVFLFPLFEWIFFVNIGSDSSKLIEYTGIHSLLISYFTFALICVLFFNVYLPIYPDSYCL